MATCLQHFPRRARQQIKQEERKGSLIFYGGGGFKIGARGRRDEWLYVHFGLMLEGEIPDVGTLPSMLNRHGDEVSTLV